MEDRPLQIGDMFKVVVFTDDEMIFYSASGNAHIPTDLVVAQEASVVESSLRLDFILRHNLRRRFVA